MFKMQSYFKLILLLSICSSISIGEGEKNLSKEKGLVTGLHDEKELARFKELDENGMLKNPISIYSNPTPRPREASINKRIYGRRKGPYEIDPNKMLSNCMYTPGYRDPDLCLNNGKVIYERGWDKRILDNLYRKHKLKQKALEVWNSLTDGSN